MYTFITDLYITTAGYKCKTENTCTRKFDYIILHVSGFTYKYNFLNKLLLKESLFVLSDLG